MAHGYDMIVQLNFGSRLESHVKIIKMFTLPKFTLPKFTLPKYGILWFKQNSLHTYYADYSV